jgi:uncharacterized BrkB/YihY/UPF0761 family membrane protein
LVNIIYGSLGTVIVVLLSFEIGAFILLLGAQVISEIESNLVQGLSWHGELAPAEADSPTTASRE